MSKLIFPYIERHSEDRQYLEIIFGPGPLKLRLEPVIQAKGIERGARVDAFPSSFVLHERDGTRSSVNLVNHMVYEVDSVSTQNQDFDVIADLINSLAKNSRRSIIFKNLSCLKSGVVESNDSDPWPRKIDAPSGSRVDELTQMSQFLRECLSSLLGDDMNTFLLQVNISEILQSLNMPARPKLGEEQHTAPALVDAITSEGDTERSKHETIVEDTSLQQIIRSGFRKLSDSNSELKVKLAYYERLFENTPNSVPLSSQIVQLQKERGDFIEKVDLLEMRNEELVMLNETLKEQLNEVLQKADGYTSHELQEKNTDSECLSEGSSDLNGAAQAILSDQDVSKCDDTEKSLAKITETLLVDLKSFVASCGVSNNACRSWLQLGTESSCDTQSKKLCTDGVIELSPPTTPIDAISSVVSAFVSYYCQDSRSCVCALCDQIEELDGSISRALNEIQANSNDFNMKTSELSAKQSRLFQMNAECELMKKEQEQLDSRLADCEAQLRILEVRGNKPIRATDTMETATMASSSDCGDRTIEAGGVTAQSHIIGIDEQSLEIGICEESTLSDVGLEVVQRDESEIPQQQPVVPRLNTGIPTVGSEAKDDGDGRTSLDDDRMLAEDQANMIEEIKSMEETRNTLANQCRCTQAKFEALKIRFREEIEDLQRSLANMKQQKNELKKEIQLALENHVKDIEIVKNEISDLNDRKQSEQSKYEALKAILEQEICASEASMTRLKDQQTELNNTLAEVRQRCESETTELKRRIAELQDEISGKKCEYETEMAKMKSEYDQLATKREQEIAMLHALVEPHQANMKDIDNKAASCQHDFEEKMSRLDEQLRTRRQQLESMKEQLRTELQSKESEHISTICELEAQEKEAMRNHEIKQQTLRDNLEAVQIEHDKRMKELTSIHQAVCKQLEDELAETKSTKEIEIQELSSAQKNQIQELHNRLSETRAAYDEEFRVKSERYAQERSQLREEMQSSILSMKQEVDALLVDHEKTKAQWHLQFEEKKRKMKDLLQQSRLSQDEELRGLKEMLESDEEKLQCDKITALIASQSQLESCISSMKTIVTSILNGEASEPQTLETSGPVTETCQSMIDLIWNKFNLLSSQSQVAEQLSLLQTERPIQDKEMQVMKQTVLPLEDKHRKDESERDELRNAYQAEILKIEKEYYDRLTEMKNEFRSALTIRQDSMNTKFKDAIELYENQIRELKGTIEKQQQKLTTLASQHVQVSSAVSRLGDGLSAASARDAHSVSKASHVSTDSFAPSSLTGLPSLPAPTIISSAKKQANLTTVRSTEGGLYQPKFSSELPHPPMS